MTKSVMCGRFMCEIGRQCEGREREGEEEEVFAFAFRLCFHADPCLLCVLEINEVEVK